MTELIQRARDQDLVIDRILQATGHQTVREFYANLFNNTIDETFEYNKGVKGISRQRRHARFVLDGLNNNFSDNFLSDFHAIGKSPQATITNVIVESDLFDCRTIKSFELKVDYSRVGPVMVSIEFWDMKYED